MSKSLFKEAKNIYGKYAVPMESDYTYTSKAILAGLVHESATIDYIINNCGEKDVLHAGAGFGDFLPALSSVCRGKVFTFEPNPVNYLACLETIKLNRLQNIELSSSGLSSQVGVGLIKVKDGDLALGVRSEVVRGQNSDNCQPIELTSIDEEILAKSRGIGIIHLDLEGFEFEALEGAQKLIARDSPIIILEIDGRAVDYNTYMRRIEYRPIKQLIYDAGEMVFVNAVYARS